MVDFGTKILGTQNATMKGIYEFISESRTFSFLHELESLLENGLIKGGDLNNAIVYVDKEISAGDGEFESCFWKRYDKCETKRDIRQSYIALPNEAARHKLLDVVGDLALMELKYKVKLLLINQGIL
jgi:UDP-3-O-[3-hydroxymyristoyl] N-acetylglucosamine deacetylase/3-hydroxyacyl-[acyl-carrier-protein] dehydratase